MEQLKCPLCATPLLQSDRQWRCDNGHSFDIAKEGYVNLLPVQKKRSKLPGDSKEMLMARREFLNKGHYQFLAEEIARLAKAQNAKEPLSLLDLGCGEGYYLSFIVQTLSDQQNINLQALDIAKDAVRMTAKRKTGAICTVASAFDTPYFENRFNFIFNVFSPYSIKELVRISKPGATLVLVGPGSLHLQELASHIYDEVKSHQGNRAQLQEPLTGFASQETVEIKDKITIKNHEIENLLAMTPYYWSISEEKKQNLIALPELTVTLHFEIQILHLA